MAKTPTKREMLLRWIADLRTPGLKQKTGQLKGKQANSCEIGHCCLGRAAEVAIASGFGEWQGERYRPLKGKDKGASASTVPSCWLASMFGIDPAGIPKNASEKSNAVAWLAALNDGRKQGFRVIADILERRFLPLAPDTPAELPTELTWN